MLERLICHCGSTVVVRSVPNTWLHVHAMQKIRGKGTLPGKLNFVPFMGRCRES